MELKRLLVVISWILIFGALVSGTAVDTVAKEISFDDFISLGRVSDPQISPDGKMVVFVITWYSKEANSGDSDIYIVPTKGLGKGESPTQLTSSEGRDAQPRFSPNGKFIAFTSSRSGKSQIWLLPLAGGEARQLTELSTGASSPQWLPDGSHLIFRSRVYPDCAGDPANTKRLAEDSDNPVQARVITELMYRHWDSWLDDRRSHVFRVPVNGGDPEDLTAGPHDVPTIALGSGNDIAVSPGGKELCIVMNVEPNLAWSTNNDLFIVPLDGATVNTGDLKSLTNNPANDNCPVYSPNGRYLAYRAMSRPGFEADQYRLMLYDRKKNKFIDISNELADKFDRSVRSINWFPDSKKIYVTCQDRGFISVYQVEVKNGKVKRLTDKNTIASMQISQDKKQVVFLKQSATYPYEVFTADKSFNKMKGLSRVNDEKLKAFDLNPLEEFQFTGAAGTPVHGFLLKPPGFKGGTKYPMIFLVHGGPQGAWEDEFHWRWNYQMFASPGYVVAMVNPRGSTGYGQRFTDEISRDWGGKVYDDLMLGLDYVLAEYDNIIDSRRIAAAGASYGGYMMNWFEGHTDRFKCLVNHDGVYNLTSMYGTTEELWFPEWDIGGTPWENPEGYEKFSPHAYAREFKTPMLIIHGQNDYRVPLGEAMQAFTALKRQGIPAKLLYFPDENHFVQKPLNAELWWTTIHEWIGDWLK